MQLTRTSSIDLRYWFCSHSRECLDKYLRDAQGSKGTKYLHKWCKENAETQILPAKMCKMLYVIVRLLQNARYDIVKLLFGVFFEN